jgi:hypothetical protein
MIGIWDALILSIMLELALESLLAFCVLSFRYEVGTVQFYSAVWGCVPVGILMVAFWQFFSEPLEISDRECRDPPT